MKTDEFIALLVAGHHPVDTAALRQRLWLSALAAVTIASVLVGLLFGIRADLAAAVTSGAVVGKAALGGSIALLSVLAYDRTLRPGRQIGRLRYWLVAPFVLAIIAAIVQLAQSQSAGWGALITGRNFVACLVSVPLLSLAPLGMLTAVARRGAPVNARRSGLLAGLASGGLAVVAYSLFCTEDSAPFVAVWYSLGIAVPAVVGALIFPHFIRW